MCKTVGCIVNENGRKTTSYYRSIRLGEISLVRFTNVP